MLYFAPFQLSPLRRFQDASVFKTHPLLFKNMIWYTKHAAAVLLKGKTILYIMINQRFWYQGKPP